MTLASNVKKKMLLLLIELNQQTCLELSNFTRVTCTGVTKKTESLVYRSRVVNRCLIIKGVKNVLQS